VPNHQPNEKTHDDVDDLIHSPLDIPMHRPTNQWLNYAKPSPPIRNNATEHAALDVTHDNENMEEQQQNI